MWTTLTCYLIFVCSLIFCSLAVRSSLWLSKVLIFWYNEKVNIIDRKSIPQYERERGEWWWWWWENWEKNQKAYTKSVMLSVYFYYCLWFVVSVLLNFYYLYLLRCLYIDSFYWKYIHVYNFYVVMYII